MFGNRNLFNFSASKTYQIDMSKKLKSKSSKEKEAPLKQVDQSPISEDKSNNIIIQVLAKPGAKQNGITGITDEGVGIQISAPPTEGEANTELVKYVASVLGLRKNYVVLDKGFKSRSKCLKIVNGTLTLADVRKKIEEEIQNNQHCAKNLDK